MLFAGRIVAYKGLDVLIHAAARLEATIEIHGDGWSSKHARNLSFRLGLGDRVRFCGWSSGPELRHAYARCGVVAVPSLWPEPFGLVGLEAMIHGRAVVASDTGGIPEWLTHGSNGYLVPAGDSVALAESIDRLISNPEHSWRMGMTGRAVAQQRFSVEQHLAGLSEVYRTTHERWVATHPRVASPLRVPERTQGLEES